jgi:WD40-like Beta Propeller Repeat
MRTSLGWLVATVVLVGCAAGGQERRPDDGTGNETTDPGGMLGGTGNLTGGGTGVVVSSCTPGTCQDFPANAINDGNVPADPASLFGDPSSGSGSGPCVSEPQDGSLFPMNWLRPRFRFQPASGETLFEIRLQTSIEKNDLVVYTSNTTWTLPGDIWAGLAAHAAGQKITVIVRGARTGGTPTRTQGTFEIAPVAPGGSMVYWATTGPTEGDATSKLVGFGVGEGGTIDALRVNQVAETGIDIENGTVKPARAGSSEGRVSCIGCHTSTPDGKAVVFNDGWPWGAITASIEKDTVGRRPSAVTAVGAKIIQQPWVGTFSFSKAVWDSGKKIGVSSYSNPVLGWDGPAHNVVSTTRLAWFDLGASGTMPTSGAELQTAVSAMENTAFGFLERSGDTRAAVNPDFSHDGTKIVYTSTEEAAGGHTGGLMRTTTESDIYVVPYNDKKGGAATKVQGASQPGVAEYYPDFSADDQLIAFTRVGNINGYFYYRPEGEIYVVPSAGGEALRLAANDPPACSGQSSPGIINSWPKWSPSVQTANGKQYYFMIFSSARQFPEQFNLPKDQYSPADTRASQLYMTAVVVENGKATTYPAVYLWNQTKNTSNLTPAWDEFQIPPVDIK